MDYEQHRNVKARKYAEALHAEHCTRGCDRPVEGYWTQFGEAVADGEMTYDEASEALAPAGR